MDIFLLLCFLSPFHPLSFSFSHTISMYLSHTLSMVLILSERTPWYIYIYQTTKKWMEAILTGCQINRIYLQFRYNSPTLLAIFHRKWKCVPVDRNCQRTAAWCLTANKPNEKCPKCELVLRWSAYSTNKHTHTHSLSIESNVVVVVFILSI